MNDSLVTLYAKTSKFGSEFSPLENFKISIIVNFPKVVENTRVLSKIMEFDDTSARYAAIPRELAGNLVQRAHLWSSNTFRQF